MVRRRGGRGGVSSKPHSGQPSKLPDHKSLQQGLRKRLRKKMFIGDWFWRKKTGRVNLHRARILNLWRGAFQESS